MIFSRIVLIVAVLAVPCTANAHLFGGSCGGHGSCGGWSTGSCGSCGGWGMGSHGSCGGCFCHLFSGSWGSWGGCFFGWCPQSCGCGVPNFGGGFQHGRWSRLGGEVERRC